MGLVKFYGKQFVLALLILGLFLLIRSGHLAPVLTAAGRMAASGLAGFALVTAAVFSPVLLALWFGVLRPEGLPGRPGREPSRQDRAWEALGTAVAFALFILAAMGSLDAPSGWVDSAEALFAMGGLVGVGQREAAAMTIVLGPFALAALPLAVVRVGRDPQEDPRGRAWVWWAAAALTSCAGAGAYLLAG